MSVTSPLATLTEPPPLPVATLRLDYQAQGRVHLPSPPANVWRGQLGYYLHRLAPEEAHAQDLSLYQHLFRTPRSAVGVPDYGGDVLGPIGLAGEHVPHPFVLRHVSPEAPGEDRFLGPGDETQVELILIGSAAGHLPQLTAIFETIGTGGLGRRVEQPSGKRKRGGVELTGASLHLQGVSLSLYDGTTWALPPTCGPELYDRAAALAPEADGPAANGPAANGPAVNDSEANGPEAERSGAPKGHLTVHLRAPTRLRFTGELVGPDALGADQLAAPLYRRAVGMAVCYGPETPTAEQITSWQDGFKALASATALDASGLRWVSDRRYSHRQERAVPAGGLAGTIRLKAPREALRVWHTWMSRAEQIHLGSGTSMGLGRLEVKWQG